VIHSSSISMSNAVASLSREAVIDALLSRWLVIVLTNEKSGHGPLSSNSDPPQISPAPIVQKRRYT